MSLYTLIPMGNRSGTVDGWSAPTGNRTRWTVTLTVGAVATSVTVLLEGSATGLSDSWSTLTNFGGAKTTVGVTTKSTLAETPDFSVPTTTRYIRARVSANTGSYAVEVKAEAAFIDATQSADIALLSQELRTWQDGLIRTVEEAENTITDSLSIDAQGLLDIDFSGAGAYHAIRRAIIQQAEWQYGTNRMRQRFTEPNVAEALRTRAYLAPGVMSGLTQFRLTGRSIWRGR